MAVDDHALSGLNLLHDASRSLRELDSWSAQERTDFLHAFSVKDFPLFLRKGQELGWFAPATTLAFRNLFYKARGNELLHDVSGIAESGTMTAVLGGGGNGTQALLEVLAHAQASTNTSGVVLLDGVHEPQDFKQRVGACGGQSLHAWPLHRHRRHGRTGPVGHPLRPRWPPPHASSHLTFHPAALVPVDDVHLPTLTVHETVLFSASQRLSATMPDSVKRLFVDIVLKLLGLSHCADTLVGSQEVRGISGGEKRRLSIAVELVAGAAVLIADRPTDGLDSSAALDFVRMCRSSCQSGGSMVHSLVQPR